MHPLARPATPALLSALLLGHPIDPQAAEWLPLAGGAPGTPAKVTVDESQSDESQTVVDVEIFGLWLEDKLGDDGVAYKQIRIPGLGFLDIPGAPQLPVANLRLGVATDAATIDLTKSVVYSLSMGEMDVWPHPLPEMDGDETGGTPEEFVRDESIYTTDLPYPPTPATEAAPLADAFGSIPMADVAIHVAKWNPVTRVLDVVEVGEYVFSHPGATRTRQPMTQDRGRIASVMCENWSEIESHFPLNTVTYEADYLIVHAPEYADELEPFIAHKASRGFNVDTIELVDGATCNAIRIAILNWYNGVTIERDKYCLLVGDVSDIPHCQSPVTEQRDLIVNTDDLYGSMDGPDLYEEVYVGRLSVDDGADLTVQLDKIMQYENGYIPSWNRNRVALVADEEDAPGKYQAAHETVRTYPYAEAPEFVTLYGSTGASDQDVIDEIDAGVGLVAYRGHGSSSAWVSWNTAGEFFTRDGDVGALDNDVRLPVVWSFSCTNARQLSNDCIAEDWLSKEDGGAVSHYGATRVSYTLPNHILDEWLFRCVFDLDMKVQSHAIAAAEWAMGVLSYTDNAWMYLLNGDPSMEIRTVNDPLIVYMPPYVGPCDFPPCGFTARVETPGGEPVSNALVSFWKPGPDGTDEVFVNRYTRSDGKAKIPVDPETAGLLYWTARDGEGRVATGTVPIVDEAVDVPEAADAAVAFRALPSVMETYTSFQFGVPLPSEASVVVVDAAGRTVASLDATTGQAAVAWDGRTDAGVPVASGVYFARLVGMPSEHVTRIVVTR